MAGKRNRNEKMAAKTIPAVAMAAALAAACGTTGGSAVGSGPPDLPGSGLEKLSWGASESQIHAAYPALGGAPGDQGVAWTLELLDLRTNNYRLAGCRYQLAFYAVSQKGKADKELVTVDFTLQSKDKAGCREKVIA